MKSAPTVSLLIASSAFTLVSSAAMGADVNCKAESNAALTPVIELYTSEGCSSCPPADKWLSTLKSSATQGRAVVQAFHVHYWDYIGWADRFATPAHRTRQVQISNWNRLNNIYTPQVVRNGLDWRDWRRAVSVNGDEMSRAVIKLQRTSADAFEASVAPAEGVTAWSAYWSVTEHAHSTAVKAGENAGELLNHDFVVRQYVPVGDYRGTQTLKFSAIAANKAHPRQVNLVVFDGKTGKTLQALSLACPA